MGYGISVSSGQDHQHKKSSNAEGDYCRKPDALVWEPGETEGHRSV